MFDRWPFWLKLFSLSPKWQTWGHCSKLCSPTLHSLSLWALRWSHVPKSFGSGLGFFFMISFDFWSWSSSSDFSCFRPMLQTALAWLEKQCSDQCLITVSALVLLVALSALLSELADLSGGLAQCSMSSDCEMFSPANSKISYFPFSKIWELVVLTESWSRDLILRRSQRSGRFGSCELSLSF